jgi:hypothetical protein
VEGAPLTHLEATLCKSAWGLATEQTHLLVCGLLRTGHLAATDTRGQLISATQIGMPLRRSVRALRPGRLLNSESWARLRRLVGLLSGDQLGPVSFVEQEKARALLAKWREESLADTELAQARLHQLRRVCNSTIAQWPRTRAAWEEIETLLAALAPNGDGNSPLERAADLDTELLAPALELWRQTLSALDEKHADLLDAHVTLTHAALTVPPQLQEQRATLLVRFDAGEEMLRDETLIAETRQWRAVYEQAYRDWHNAQHAPPRFAAYRSQLSGDMLRALDRLSSLTARPFAQNRELRTAATEELGKHCLRDGALSPGEVICSQCRLRWGERLPLRSPDEIEGIGHSGIGALRLALREPAVKSVLTRHEETQELLHWNEEGDGECESLLRLLSNSALLLLDEALCPHREVRRSLADLENRFRSCHTRRDFTDAFTQWLDAGDHLSDADQVLLENVRD